MATAAIPSAAALDSDALYEVVNGEIREIPPMGAYQGWIASLLIQYLSGQQKYGRAVVEVLFDFSESLGRKRRPDLAFVRYERWPREHKVPDAEAWAVAPNLAVEVVSPTNPADEIVEKISDYFQAGVERVWVIYSSQQQVYVYASPTDVNVLTEVDELADEALLPGFRLPLRTLFDDTAAAK